MSKCRCYGEGCRHCSDGYSVPCERCARDVDFGDADKHTDEFTGLPYCSLTCRLLTMGERILEDTPLCFVADPAVHAYAAVRP